ncbi:MAG: helix-turn-helix domain-containing protein, partial [Lachnospiraceae bacterium]|nr:helix-turn-helix domain-containing protein [Lachnospiraceae bacterium]
MNQGFFIGTAEIAHDFMGQFEVVGSMLLFSDYLRELMQKKHMTVSALARLCGIERTMLSRTLSGQRVLPYQMLDEMIFHLKLTLEEEKLFRSYYDAQFEKEGTRFSREIIGNMFSDLACLNLKAPAFEETRLLLNLDQYAG